MLYSFAVIVICMPIKCKYGHELPIVSSFFKLNRISPKSSEVYCCFFYVNKSQFIIFFNVRHRMWNKNQKLNWHFISVQFFKNWFFQQKSPVTVPLRLQVSEMEKKSMNACMVCMGNKINKCALSLSLSIPLVHWVIVIIPRHHLPILLIAGATPGGGAVGSGEKQGDTAVANQSVSLATLF